MRKRREERSRKIENQGKTREGKMANKILDNRMNETNLYKGY